MASDNTKTQSKGSLPGWNIPPELSSRPGLLPAPIFHRYTNKAELQKPAHNTAWLFQCGHTVYKNPNTGNDLDTTNLVFFKDICAECRVSEEERKKKYQAMTMLRDQFNLLTAQRKEAYHSAVFDVIASLDKTLAIIAVEFEELILEIENFEKDNLTVEDGKKKKEADFMGVWSKLEDVYERIVVFSKVADIREVAIKDCDLRGKLRVKFDDASHELKMIKYNLGEKKDDGFNALFALDREAVETELENSWAAAIAAVKAMREVWNKFEVGKVTPGERDYYLDSVPSAGRDLIIRERPKNIKRREVGKGEDNVERQQNIERPKDMEEPEDLINL